MIMNILQKAEEYIFQLFKDTPNKGYFYHDFTHTIRVVRGVEELVAGEKVTEQEALLLKLAAWFHDVGYINGCEQHEERGAQIAESFLKENDFDAEDTATVKRLILSTQLSHEPVDNLEMIMRDADFYHFAEDNYIEISNLLKKELEFCSNSCITDLMWNKGNWNIMSRLHRYYTDYAKKNWQPKKEDNLLKVADKLEKMIEEDTSKDKAKEKKKKAKEERPERGIDTVFRVTLNNHTRLSGIADSKANILLSVNAIIISISLSALIPKLDSPSNAHLIIPTFILLLSSVITIIFAILSTKPKVTSGSFTRDDINNRKVNLLFFGNFYEMPLEEYTWAMNEMMKDREYLYNSMIKDLYYLGIVLDRKYKLLRITYNVFMFGLIASVISFILAFKGIGF